MDATAAFSAPYDRGQRSAGAVRSPSAFPSQLLDIQAALKSLQSGCANGSQNGSGEEIPDGLMREERRSGSFLPDTAHQIPASLRLIEFFVWLLPQLASLQAKQC